MVISPAHFYLTHQKKGRNMKYYPAKSKIQGTFFIGLIVVMMNASAVLAGPGTLDMCWILMNNLYEYQDDMEDHWDQCKSVVQFKLTANDSDGFDVYYGSGHFSQKTGFSSYRLMKGTDALYVIDSEFFCDPDSDNDWLRCTEKDPHSVTMQWVGSLPNLMRFSLRNLRTNHSISFGAKCENGMLVGSYDNTKYTVSFQKAETPCIR